MYKINHATLASQKLPKSISEVPQCSGEKCAGLSVSPGSQSSSTQQELVSLAVRLNVEPARALLVSARLLQHGWHLA